jgi:predicted ATPase
MKVRSLRIENLQSFQDSGFFELSPRITVIIGENNSGKSTILTALGLLQNVFPLRPESIHARAPQIVVTYKVEKFDSVMFPLTTSYDLNELLETDGLHHLRYRFQHNGEIVFQLIFKDAMKGVMLKQAKNEEPSNYIYPFSSKRKVSAYVTQINAENSRSVRTNLSMLIPKVDALLASGHDRHDLFARSCEEILGFRISSFAYGDGKDIGLMLSNNETILVSSMGEGVAQTLGMLCALCVAENKLIVIEEPENDLHPRVLRGLLSLFALASNNNQLVITTHSNIVLSSLGALPDTVILATSMEIVEKVPLSHVRQVSDEPQARLEVLESLGYDLIDYGLHSAYIIFEESSAERLFREYFIKWYSPGLIGKVRTIASQGVSDVEPKLADLERLFLFTHLEPLYETKTWVIVDGDAAGAHTMKELKAKYLTGKRTEDQFISLTKEAFEHYYPSRFDEQVAAVLAIKDKQRLRKEKRKLLNDVLEWIHVNEELAKAEFKSSAPELISTLERIESTVIGRK